jgi:hypothetical protein
MAETKRPGVMGTGEEETFVRKLQYSLLFVEDDFQNFKSSTSLPYQNKTFMKCFAIFFYINRTT